MHGVVLYGLKAFVTDTYGAEAWRAVCEEAGIEQRLFVPVTEYPDEYVVDLVSAASELTGESPETLQYEFGQYVVPKLVDVYGVHVDGDWSAMELVENVEQHIHEALRAKDLSEFSPPAIGARRVDEDEVVVTYASDRGLCALARGILEGIADYYDEEWYVTERQCMHEGAAHCEIGVVERRPVERSEAADSEFLFPSEDG